MKRAAILDPSTKKKLKFWALLALFCDPEPRPSSNKSNNIRIDSQVKLNTHWYHHCNNHNFEAPLSHHSQIKTFHPHVHP